MRSNQWNQRRASSRASMFDLAFFVRFAFGLIGGAAFALIFMFYTGLPAPWIVTLFCSLLCGLLSAFFGDEFWSNFGKGVSGLLWWW